MRTISRRQVGPGKSFRQCAKGWRPAGGDPAPGVPEALESLERERPNVMLPDIEMPGEDGYALIRKVRALPPDRNGQTPAAALTGLGTSADRARVLQAGFQDHVAKPVDAGQLVRIVTTLAVKG